MLICSRLAFMAILLANQAFGAECRVDGVWYPYNSPQCSSSSPPAPSRARPVAAPRGDTWSAEKPKAITRCQARHPDSFSLQNGCLSNEERGFQAMQRDYDLPPEVASKAKARCTARHDSWSLRNGCMSNESRSYQKLYK